MIKKLDLINNDIDEKILNLETSFEKIMATSMMSENETKVYSLLQELEIPYVKYEHIPIFTIEEADKLDVNIEGTHCKNLFLRNRKEKNTILLL